MKSLTSGFYPYITVPSAGASLQIASYRYMQVYVLKQSGSRASPLTCWIIISSIAVLVATLTHHVIPSPNLETKLLAGTLPDRLEVQSGEAIEEVLVLVSHVAAARDDRT